MSSFYLFFPLLLLVLCHNFFLYSHFLFLSFPKVYIKKKLVSIIELITIRKVFLIILFIYLKTVYD